MRKKRKNSDFARFDKIEKITINNNKDAGIGRGNNPMVGMTVAVAVALSELL